MGGEGFASNVIPYLYSKERREQRSRKENEREGDDVERKKREKEVYKTGKG